MKSLLFLGTVLCIALAALIACQVLPPATQSPVASQSPIASPIPGWVTDFYNRMATPASHLYEITEIDSGKTFTYTLTGRFSVILDSNKYPRENFEYEPPDIVGAVSSIYPVPAPLYVMRYETVKLGTGTIRNGRFAVTINVVTIKMP